MAVGAGRGGAVAVGQQIGKNDAAVGAFLEWGVGWMKRASAAAVGAMRRWAFAGWKTRRQGDAAAGAKLWGG